MSIGLQMETLLIVLFVLGYLAIALEHQIRVDKAASALLLGGVCWTLLVFAGDSLFPGLAAADVPRTVEHGLAEHLSEISSILFFLLGAMTIVELIDAHSGFRVITDRIHTTNRVALLWVVGSLTFLLSAVLDNLTTAIVVSALLKKVMRERDDLWTFGGVVIIAANAGGAWSPIGDVTTIMLWIGGQISALNVVKVVLLPSVVCLVIPLLVLSVTLKGDFERVPALGSGSHRVDPAEAREQWIMLSGGILGLLFVPVFKTVTHLPPYIGMLISLGVLWVLNEFIHRSKDHDHRRSLSVAQILTRVDVPTVLFFLGILLAVGALQMAGVLADVAAYLDQHLGDVFLISTVIGILSAVVDNVPLVAGAIGMYPLSQFPQDHIFWELLAYTAGTGGSLLIIGSAAGVAVMGVLHIDFMWYLRRISLLAASGYFAGIGAFYLQKLLTGG
jgi:Na+/H+ antiporter NhaD/arsenite permease-like protein